METFAPTGVYRHTRIRIATAQPTEFVDLTDRLESLVAEAALTVGLVNIQTLHTTTALVINEHEPLLLQDFAALLEAAAPRDAVYRHDDGEMRQVNLMPGERPNGHAHCRALFLGATACVNVVDGRLVLGRWQRIFLAELDGPRPREISVVMMGEGRR